MLHKRRAGHRVLGPLRRLHGRAVCLGGVLAAASSLVASSSSALGDTAATEAKALFAQARDLRAHGDCASAAPVFRKAYELYPSGLGSLRNLAECEESLAHFASSRRAWIELDRALAAHNESKYEGWSADARDGAARLEPKLATLTVDIEAVTRDGIPSGSALLNVEINGERLQPDLVGRPLDRDPGRCVVIVGGAPGVALEERIVDLTAGDAKRVVFHIVLPPSRVEQGSPGLGAIHDAKTAENRRHTVAWISVGVGGASIIAASIAGIAYQSALDDFDRQCPSGHCDGSPSSRSKVDAIVERGHAASTWVDVFVVAGAVGVGTGIVLFATGESTKAKATLVVSPTGLSALGRF